VEQHIYPQTVGLVSKRCKNPIKHVGLVQSELHRHLIEMKLVLAIIWLKHCSLGIPHQSLTPFIFNLQIN
jgi:hypothetical protein